MLNLKKSDNDIAIYINFPFCKRPCSYCHYVKNIKFGYSEIPDQYISLILEQLEDILITLDNKTINSIYFGGGTPSLLNNEQIIKIENLFKKYNISSREVSIEIYPGMCNFDYINNNFFSRYSFGIQTLHPSIAKKYLRSNYDSDTIRQMILNIRESNFLKKINFDFIFSDTLSKYDIDFVNMLKPETVVFYPNTKDRGKERLKNVLETLKIIEKELESYHPLGKSKFIYIRNDSQPSFYAKVEYETYGDIIGIGHNSVTYLGDQSFLCVYEKDSVLYRQKLRNNRVFHAFLSGIATGVQKKYVNILMPNICLQHFLYTVDKHLDISDRGAVIHDDELVFLPESEYIRFAEYLCAYHTKECQNIFLSSVGFGDNNLEVINEVYNTEYENTSKDTVQILKKKKTPRLRILVEGIDGSGKDTFVKFLVMELKKRFFYANDSKISVSGQPNSQYEQGEICKKFVEELWGLESCETIKKALFQNRKATEEVFSNMKGIVILLRGFVTEKATFQYAFNKDEDLGEGKFIKQFDKFIVIDADIEIADSRIEKRGIPRTWRENKKVLGYFKNYYLNYDGPIFREKIIIENNFDSKQLHENAIKIAESIYQEND